MLGRQYAQLGVSLVEVAVGLAVTAALLVTGLPSFNSWIQGSRIRTTVEGVQNGLQLARAEAVRRNTNVQFILTDIVAGGTGAGWTVSCVTPVDDLDADGIADCPGAGVVPAQIRQRPAAEGSSNVVVATVQPTIVFTGLGRITPRVTNIDIDVTYPSGGACASAGGTMRCLRTQVSGSGQIRLCDPALSTTDPQGCLP